MLRPGDTFGHYRIEKTLGEGGMGIVYEAKDTDNGTAVALKVVNPDLALDPDGNQGIEAARRLVREGRAAGSLRHPNAIAVLDSGEIDGVPYIAMELVRGRSLGQFIGDKRIPMDQRIEWLTAMARGLAAAHSQGIVHRDVKPENVMVCDDGWVKLFDFGVAKPIADPRSPIDLTVVTHTGIVVGTPLYMAPEQVLGDKLDLRSDQYAWATVAYELLSTGMHPITTTAESHLPVPFAILKGTPKHLREIAPAVPPRVADVVMRALSRDPKARYPRMDEIVAALDAYFNHGSDADTTAKRPQLSSGIHSEPTVAVVRASTAAPVPAPNAPTLVDAPSSLPGDGRDTITRHYQRAPQSVPASPNPNPNPVGEPKPRVGPPSSAVGSERESRKPAPRSVRAPMEERADPSVFGPAGPPPGSQPLPPVVPSLGEAALLNSFVPPASPDPPSVRMAIESQANRPAPLRKGLLTPENIKRLLWIPILILAAFAGYGSYVLLAR
jgi:serine/threonine protein kinase